MLVAGCGARTGLSTDSRDAGMDAPSDARDGMDAPRDVPGDADVPSADVPSADVPDVREDAPDAPRDAGRDAADAPRADAPDPSLLGCADGEREGFLDRTRHARIAGCSGGFAVPGLLLDEPPSCGRAAGDDGPLPRGEGCRSADLCAEGWHVCRSAREVMLASPGGCDGVAGLERAFFASRQSGPGCGICATGVRSCALGECALDCAADPSPGSLMANDLFGCGTLGDPPSTNCAPLDRFSNDLCGSTTAPWSCPGSTGYDEALVVRKTGPERGGVLCCRDDVRD